MTLQIKLSERAKECAQTYKEIANEMEDYNHIVMCIRALQAAQSNPDKFKYEQKDYDLVVTRLRSLCAKHEVQLPDTDYIEWTAIEIV